MKPFDLEAAKRGEPILYALNPSYPITFIGARRDGSIVYEDTDGGLATIREMGLRMAPKKRTVWVNLYRTSGRGCYYNSEADANSCWINLRDDRIGGKAHPIEIEE